MEKEKKRSKAGLWLIAFGVLLVPVVILSFDMAANAGREGVKRIR